MAKYVKCDACGKPIVFGEDVYRYDGLCGLFCSAECFADSYATCNELDEELADDCCHEVYDSEELKRELRHAISNLQRELDYLTARLDTLEDAPI